MKNTLLATAALTLLATFTGSARADEFDHIDSLATQMQNQTARAAAEVRRNFQGIPQYRHLYNDIYEMYTLAGHIHEMVHEGRNLNHIRADIASLDRLFHHVEEVVDDIRPVNIHSGHWHGSHWGHFHSGPSRDDVRRLRNLMSRMEDTIHHLQDDLRVLSGPFPAASIIRPVPYEVRMGNNKFGLSVQIP